MTTLLRKFSNNLTAQVALALLLGVTVGAQWPDVGVSMQMLSDIFIKLIKMVIPPIAFLTIVIGIAEVRDLRRLGRVGGQAFIYFEVVSTIALIVGLIIMNVLKPGAGFDRTAVGSQAIDISKYKAAPVGSYLFDFLSGIVPDNAVAAFAKGDLLQIVFFGVLFGCAAVLVGERARPDVA